MVPKKTKQTKDNNHDKEAVEMGEVWECGLWIVDWDWMEKGFGRGAKEGEEGRGDVAGLQLPTATIYAPIIITTAPNPIRSIPLDVSHFTLQCQNAWQRLSLWNFFLSTPP